MFKYVYIKFRKNRKKHICLLINTVFIGQSMTFLVVPMSLCLHPPCQKSAKSQQLNILYISIHLFNQGLSMIYKKNIIITNHHRVP